MLVCCMGMPRAASTLHYNIAAELVERTNRGRRLGYFNTRALTYFQKRKLLRCQLDSSFYVIKSHNALPHNFVQEEGSVRILYSYRDLRDVARSLKRVFGVAGEELLARLDNVLAEEKRINQISVALNMSYEELTGDLSFAIRKTAAFLGVGVEDQVVNELASDLAMNQIGLEYRRAHTRPAFRIKAIAWKINSILRIGGFARFLGVSPSAREIFKRPFYLHDSHTLFHSSHVAPATRRIELTHWERNAIEEEFYEWLTERGYWS